MKHKTRVYRPLFGQGSPRYVLEIIRIQIRTSDSDRMHLGAVGGGQRSPSALYSVFVYAYYQ